MNWFEAKEEEFSPVISTRVRFARNLSGKKFPRKMTPKEKKEVCEAVRGALRDREPMFVDFGKASKGEKEAYVQTYLASRELADKGEGSGLLISREGNVSVMLCEEDHVRLQAVLKGKKIRACYELALDWEKALEEKIDVAYDPALGYLTACPTNLGAAMRVSVMIHLPALKETGRLYALTRSLNDLGFTVRGLFGEGSEGTAGIYQISNQMSRDAAPEEIVSSFEKVVEQVILEEEKARAALFSDSRTIWEDKICRAMGIVSFARSMSFAEWIELYSLIRLGKEAGLPEAARFSDPDRCLIEAMPAYLLLRDASLSSPQLRDEARAARLHESIK